MSRWPHEEHDWDAILATVRGDQFSHVDFSHSGADVTAEDLA